jgi:hypothetical protein
MGSRSEFNVLYTAPDHPRSNALLTISALFETGDEESKKGLMNVFPQNSTLRSTDLLDMMPPPYCRLLDLLFSA